VYSCAREAVGQSNQVSEPPRAVSRVQPCPYQSVIPSTSTSASASTYSRDDRVHTLTHPRIHPQPFTHMYTRARAHGHPHTERATGNEVRISPSTNKCIQLYRYPTRTDGEGTTQWHDPSRSMIPHLCSGFPIRLPLEHRGLDSLGCLLQVLLRQLDLSQHHTGVGVCRAVDESLTQHSRTTTHCTTVHHHTTTTPASQAALTRPALNDSQGRCSSKPQHTGGRFYACVCNATVREWESVESGRREVTSHKTHAHSDTLPLPHTHTHTHTHNHTPKHTPKHSHMLTPTHPPTPTSAGDIGVGTSRDIFPVSSLGQIDVDTV
jgi:hypothetical protein